MMRLSLVVSMKSKKILKYRIKYSTRRDMKHCKYIMTKKNVCKIKNRHKLYVRVKAYKQVGTKKIYSVKWAK